MATPRKSKWSIRDMAYIAIFAVVLAVCSWICVPYVVPFTLQTFGVFLAVGVLGGRRGTLAVLVYILLGCMGLPVFAGFTGGIGILLGSTGGFFLGFLPLALTMWAMEGLPGNRAVISAVSMVLGLAACYAFGTVWFLLVYARTASPVGVWTVLGWCVLPYILPDLAKIALALGLQKRLRAAIRPL